ncbi:MAG: M48 family metallopeptidase [Phascolarctobacterium sp.]
MSNVTKRSVAVNGEQIRYFLERKAVKNLNLRVHPDGTVYVSAPRLVPLAIIDRFVLDKAVFIQEARARFMARQAAQEKLQGSAYKHGDIIYLLGKPVAIALIPDAKNSVVLAENLIMLYLSDVENIALRQKLVQKLLDELCQQVFQKVLLEQYELVRPYGVPLPALRMRTMKSRWGSCLFLKGIVTMNKRLIHMPLPCIEQVMLHELCHFLVCNHSPSFYAWLDKLMPDWRERKALLNQWAEKV